MLGAIIERVTGLTYAQYMQQAVFEPAGLRRTTVGDAEGLPDRAVGYTFDLHGRRIPAPRFDMSLAYSAGGIRSTAGDLARWHSVLGTDLLLKRESRQLLTTPVCQGYGFGWRMSELSFEVVAHDGGIIGFQSELVRVPELDLAVIVLLNAETLSSETIASAALRCALGNDIPPNPPPPPIDLDASQRKRFVGSYHITAESLQLIRGLGYAEAVLATMQTAEVSEQQEDLFLLHVARQPQLMLANSGSEFVLPGLGGTLQFSFGKGETGPATAFAFEDSGTVLHYER